MTVSSTTNRKTFAGNGVTTSFGTSPMTFFDTSDLVVSVVDDTTGAVTLLVENTDYSATGGDGSTGTISTAGGSAPYGAPAVDTTLVVVRVLPVTQSVDLVNNDINDAEVMEGALDKLTMLVQQQLDTADRSVRLATGDSSDGDDMVLPSIPDRASRVLGFDADGAVTTYDASSTVTTSDNVTFTPAGTGAVATTVQAKLRETKSITDYGADVGNTAAQNRVAIQAAIDANYGKALIVPPGTFQVNTAGSTTAPVGDALSIVDEILLVFEGIIKGTNNCNVIHINAGTQDVVTLCYEGGGVQGYGTFFEATNRNGSLVKVTAGIPRIYQIKMIDPPQYAIISEGADEGHVSEVEIIGGQDTYPGDNNYGICLVDASLGWKIDGIKTLENATGGKVSQAVASITLGTGTADRTQVLNSRLFHQWEKGTYLIADDCQINDNWVRGNPNGEGLRVVGKRPIVCGNDVRTCESGGITLYNAEGGLCANNQVSDYLNAGIQLAYDSATVTSKSLSRAQIVNNKIKGRTTGTAGAAIDVRGDASHTNVEERIIIRGNEIETANYDSSDEKAGIYIAPGHASTIFRDFQLEQNIVADCGSYGIRFLQGTYPYARVKGNLVRDPGMQSVALGGNRPAYRWDSGVTMTGEEISGNKARSETSGSGMDYGFSNNTEAGIQSVLLADNNSRGHITGGYLNMGHSSNLQSRNRAGDTYAPDTVSLTPTGAITTAANFLFSKNGNVVTMQAPTNRVNGASSATPITYPAIAAHLRPSNVVHGACQVTDNGSDQAVAGEFRINTNGTIVIYKTFNFVSFTSSGATTGHEGFSTSWLVAGT